MASWLQLLLLNTLCYCSLLLTTAKHSLPLSTWSACWSLSASHDLGDPGDPELAASIDDLEGVATDTGATYSSSGNVPGTGGEDKERSVRAKTLLSS
jgi:hypothetical protein